MNGMKRYLLKLKNVKTTILKYKINSYSHFSIKIFHSEDFFNFNKKLLSIKNIFFIKIENFEDRIIDFSRFLSM